MKIYTAGVALSTLAVLAGCGTAMYDKPGVTYAEWKQDDAQCRRASVDPGGGPDRAAYVRCMRERGYRIGDD